MGIFNRKTKIELEATKAKLRNVEQKLEARGKRVNLSNAVITDNMDLSRPYVNDSFSVGVNHVEFGETNLHPSILNDLYLTSPMHSACVDFKTWSVIGNGIEWKNYDSILPKEKMNIKEFIKTNDFNKASRDITKNWVKHGRSIVLLHYNKESGIFDKFKVADPAEIRNDRETLFTDISTYYYANDWMYGNAIARFTPYSINNTDEWQVLEIKNYAGIRSYGLPDWISSANWQSVSANLGLLHKSALENGIQPSVLFVYPYLMDDEEEKQWTRGMRDDYKGVKNYNRALKIESQGKELMPEVKVLETSDNHQLFEQTSKEQKEEIAISHNINPALMGVRIAGSLGANEEIEFSAKQFEKIWLNDNRMIIQDFLSEIASICGIKSTLIISKTELTSYVEKKEDEEKELSNKNKRV